MNDEIIIDDDQFAKQAVKLVKFHISSKTQNIDKLNAAFLEKLNSTGDDFENKFQNQFKNTQNGKNGTQLLTELSSEESVSVDSGRNKKKKKRDGNSIDAPRNGVQNQLWDCDTTLQVKEMLLSTSKKSQLDLENFQLRLHDRTHQNDDFLNQANYGSSIIQKTIHKDAKIMNKVEELELRSDITSEDEDLLKYDLLKEFDAKKIEKKQITQLDKVKDLYEKNLHQLLLEKQTLEKSLRQEKLMRQKYEEEAKNLRFRIDTEMKTIRSKIEEEFRSSFSMKQNSMWSKFQDEMQKIAGQYFDIKQYNGKKDQVVFKLCNVISQQEKDILSLRLQLKSTQRENQLLTNPSKLSLLSSSVKNLQQIQEQRQQVQQQQLEEQDIFEDERKRYQEHIQYLDEELEILRDIMGNWIRELETSKIQLQEMKNQNEKMRSKFKFEFDEMVHKFEVEVSSLKNENKVLSGKLKDYEEHMKGELKIKEEIEQRQQQYIDVLRGEVMTAKRILGNNRLRDQAYKEINFESVFYYDYIPKTSAQGKPKAQFDPNKVNIVKNAVTSEERQIFSSSLIRGVHYKDDSILNLNFQRPITQGYDTLKTSMAKRKRIQDQTTVASTNVRRKLSIPYGSQGFSDQLEDARRGLQTAKNTDRISENHSLERTSPTFKNHNLGFTIKGWSNKNSAIKNTMKFQNKSVINSLEQSIESDYKPDQYTLQNSRLSKKPKMSTSCNTPKHTQQKLSQQTSIMANAFYNLDNSIISQS